MGAMAKDRRAASRRCWKSTGDATEAEHARRQGNAQICGILESSEQSSPNAMGTGTRVQRRTTRSTEEALKRSALTWLTVKRRPQPLHCPWPASFRRRSGRPRCSIEDPVRAVQVTTRRTTVAEEAIPSPDSRDGCPRARMPARCHWGPCRRARDPRERGRDDPERRRVTGGVVLLSPLRAHTHTHTEQHPNGPTCTAHAHIAA